MRFLARIAKSAVLSPIVTKSPDLFGIDHYLDLDGHRAIVRFKEGGVQLKEPDGRWTYFRLRKHTAGRIQAERIYVEITKRDQLAAQRMAAYLERIAEEEKRAFEEQKRVATIRAECVSLQARLDATLAECGLSTRNGVRFYVSGARGEKRLLPTYVPTRGAMTVELSVTPERARELLEILIREKFLHPLPQNCRSSAP
jgi:hypothetical protein